MHALLFLFSFFSFFPSCVEIDSMNWSVIRVLRPHLNGRTTGLFWTNGVWISIQSSKLENCKDENFAIVALSLPFFHQLPFWITTEIFSTHACFFGAGIHKSTNDFKHCSSYLTVNSRHAMHFQNVWSSTLVSLYPVGSFCSLIFY